MTLPDVEPAGRSSLRGYLRNLAELLSEPAVAFMLASFVVRWFLFYGYLTYFSALVLRGVGLPPVAAGIAVSIKSVGSVVGSTQVGRLGAAWPLSLLVTASLALSGIGIALSGLVLTLASLVVGAILLGLSDGVGAPAQKSLVTGLAPTRLRAGAISSSSTSERGGKAAAPVVLAAVVVAYWAGPAVVALGVAAGTIGMALVLGVYALARDGGTR